VTLVGNFMVHLDTNFLISAIQPGSPEDAHLRSWLGAGESLGISAVAWAEFFCGPLPQNDERVARQLFQRQQPTLVAVQPISLVICVCDDPQPDWASPDEQPS